jgi:hypothetical protein
MQIRADVLKKQRLIDVAAARKTCMGVHLEFMRFFAAHAWTGKHGSGDFGNKIGSTYCLVRVDNAAIVASGRHVNYLKSKKGTGQGGGGKAKRADKKKRRVDDDEEQDDELEGDEGMWEEEEREEEREEEEEEE